MKTKTRRVLLCVLAPIAVLAVLTGFVIARQGRETAQLPFESISIAGLADGVYTGTAETLLVKATVKVTVKNEALNSIRITRHENGMGSAAETTVQTMVAQNTLAVDAVSGATVSSKVLQSAVYDALTHRRLVA